MYLRKSLNSFMNQRFFEAEEFIFKAAKLNPGVTDFSVLLRLGYIYLKRESIEDAYTVLCRACGINSKSSLAWIGLAVASLSLDRPEEAETSLRMANILDPINSEILGYTILLSLKDSRKTDVALQILAQYLNLPITNLEVLNHIGEVLMNLDHDFQAYEVFYRLLELEGNASIQFKEANINLAKIHPKSVLSLPKSTQQKDASNPLISQVKNSLGLHSSQNKKDIELDSEYKTHNQDARSKLLIKPLFLQENSPHTPTYNLPKVYWIVGQLLHKF